jgi:hypothetical protein
MYRNVLILPAERREHYEQRRPERPSPSTPFAPGEALPHTSDDFLRA